MTDLQKRRRIVSDAILAHLSTHGEHEWCMVQDQFPELPPASFWRYVKRVKQEHGYVVPPKPKVWCLDSDFRVRARRASILTPAEFKTALAIERRTIEEAFARQALTEALGIRTLGKVMVTYEIQVLSKLRTAVKQRQSMAFIIEALADKPCSEFAVDDLAPIIEQVRARGAPAHAERMLSYFSAFCGWACEQGYLQERPYLASLRSMQETPRDRSLSRREVGEVWRAAGALGFPFGPAIRLLILTGAQRQDVAEMPRWAIRVNDDGETFWPVQDRRHGERGEFHVPLSPQAQQIIEEASASPPAKRKLLFSTNGKTPVSGWSRAKRRLDVAIRDAREERWGAAAELMEPWRLNDLRRSFFALAVEHLQEEPIVVGRCLNRLREASNAKTQGWATDDDMFAWRQSILFRWANFVLAEASGPSAEQV